MAEEHAEHLEDRVAELEQRVEQLRKRAERERRRRGEAERIAEKSTRELYQRNEELEQLTDELEGRVEQRTADLQERLDQQMALQQVSQFALRRMDVDALVHELCQRTAEVLDVDFCDVFQLGPEHEELVLRAGVGWPEGSIDQVTLDASEGTQSGHTVQSWEPTVIEDHRADDRFRRPEPFEEMGIVSGITVVVPAPEDPWGVFGIHAREPQAFDAHDVAFIQSMSRVLSMAIQRQRAQIDLEQEKERFESLVHSVEEYAIFSCDAEGLVRTWNVGAERIKGYSEEEILGEHFRVFYPEEARKAGAPERNLQRAAEQGSYEDEGWRVRKDGSRFWANVTITTLYDDEGEVRGYAKVTRDMTDRMQRERRLQESRRRYQTLVDNFPNGAVALVDEELRYQMVGGSPPAGIEASLDEIRGQPVSQALPSELAAKLVPCYEAAFEGEKRTFEHEAEGQVFRFRVVPVRDELGEIFAAMGMSQEITEAKERERDLAASNERLERFAYAASHDLQEPLRTVASYLQLFEDRYGDEIDEDGLAYLHQAEDGARRMREMIDSLLTYARVRSQGKPLRPVDADGVLEDALSDLQVQIEETGAELSVASLGTVAADPDQLAQVFRNVVSNALKYSGDEPPSIEITAELVDGMRRFSVNDEGVGMTPEEAEAAFDVFQRVGSEGDERGTGIGLAICEQIVDRHGGEIWADSQPGEGTTVHFTMPVP